MMTSVGYEEIKALVRMSGASDAFVAKVAKATLSVIEGFRDAEIRAALAETALAVEQARLAAIRDALARFAEAKAKNEADPAHIVEEITELAG